MMRHEVMSISDQWALDLLIVQLWQDSPSSKEEGRLPHLWLSGCLCREVEVNNPEIKKPCDL